MCIHVQFVQCEPWLASGQVVHGADSLVIVTHGMVWCVGRRLLSRYQHSILSTHINVSRCFDCREEKTRNYLGMFKKMGRFSKIADLSQEQKQLLQLQDVNS